MTTAVILAAGKSTRMGEGVDKAFLSLVDRPVVAWSLQAFERCADVDRIILVVRKDQIVASKAVAKMFGISKLQTVVAGGARRQDSVLAQDIYDALTDKGFKVFFSRITLEDKLGKQYEPVGRQSMEKHK